jgi:hypothetical protein
MLLTVMNVLRARDPAEAATLAAAQIARACVDACVARGRAVLAVSGGETPWLMLAELARHRLPWSAVHVTQVDERIAHSEDPRRNLARLRRILVEDGPLPEWNLLPLPVQPCTRAKALASRRGGGRGLRAALKRLAGEPPVLDPVQRLAPTATRRHCRTMRCRGARTRSRPQRSTRACCTTMTIRCCVAPARCSGRDR